MAISHSILISLAMALAVSGCGTSRRLVQPDCPAPAAVEGHLDYHAPGFFIQFRGDSREYSLAMARIERDYVVKVDVYPEKSGFISSFLPPREFARLRCDPAVELIEFNARISI
jgi:hypothetical protein